MTKRFGGFLVASSPSVEVPLSFFTDVLPQLGDLAEVQVTLAVFRLAAANGGVEAPVSQHTLLHDAALRSALRVVGSPREPDRRVVDGLDLAVGRGTLLSFTASHGSDQQVWYYVNTPVNQALMAAMSRGAVAPPPAIWKDEHPPLVSPERPNVFRLYEQNIGLLTPLITDQIVDALETYPGQWIEDAITEAVTYNRRSWRYVQRILEKWATDGRGSKGGKERGHETNRRRDAEHFDPDQYKHGRHLQRRGSG